jgi:hypothetical protein
MGLTKNRFHASPLGAFSKSALGARGIGVGGKLYILGEGTADDRIRRWNGSQFADIVAYANSSMKDIGYIGSNQLMVVGGFTYWRPTGTSPLGDWQSSIG